MVFLFALHSIYKTLAFVKRSPPQRCGSLVSPPKFNPAVSIVFKIMFLKAAPKSGIPSSNVRHKHSANPRPPRKSRRARSLSPQHPLPGARLLPVTICGPRPLRCPNPKAPRLPTDAGGQQRLRLQVVALDAALRLPQHAERIQNQPPPPSCRTPSGARKTSSSSPASRPSSTRAC